MEEQLNSDHDPRFHSALARLEDEINTLKKQLLKVEENKNHEDYMPMRSVILNSLRHRNIVLKTLFTD